jgi:hypothetical protein
VATKFAEVRKMEEAAAGATAIAPRRTVVDADGTWEEVRGAADMFGWTAAGRRLCGIRRSCWRFMLRGCCNQQA